MVVLGAGNLVLSPSYLEPVQAATLPTAAQTAWHALTSPPAARLMSGNSARRSRSMREKGGVDGITNQPHSLQPAFDLPVPSFQHRGRDIIGSVAGLGTRYWPGYEVGGVAQGA